MVAVARGGRMGGLGSGELGEQPLGAASADAQLGAELVAGDAAAVGGAVGGVELAGAGQQRLVARPHRLPGPGGRAAVGTGGLGGRVGWQARYSRLSTANEPSSHTGVAPAVT